MLGIAFGGFLRVKERGQGASTTLQSLAPGRCPPLLLGHSGAVQDLVIYCGKITYRGSLYMPSSQTFIQ